MGYAKTEYKLKRNYVHCLWYTYTQCIVDEEKLHLPSIHLNELTECDDTTETQLKINILIGTLLLCARCE